MPKKVTPTPIQKVLTKIRPVWVARVAQELARGMEVRADATLPELDFRIRCSKGFYVRTYAHDLGQKLGCGAHLRSLRRTAIGPHEVATALPAARLTDPQAVREALLPPLAALAHLPAVQLDDAGRRAVGRGGSVHSPAPPGDGPLVLVHGDELLAIAERRDGRIQPRKVFARD